MSDKDWRELLKPLDIVDDRTPEQKKADGDDKPFEFICIRAILPDIRKGRHSP